MLIKRRLIEILLKYLEDREFIAIRGPRQSGKTTILKLLYERLSKEHGENYVFYKTLEDPFELQAFSKSPVEYIKLLLKDGKRHYLLLDEIQYDKAAGRHLKLVYDTMSNVKIIVTGSSTLDMGEISGYMVGRMHIFDLLTLRFDEYLGFGDRRLQQEFYAMNSVFSDVLNGKDPHLPESGGIFLDRINVELERFMLFGGYPAVCLRDSEEGKLQMLKDIYITYLEKDVARLFGLKEEEVKGISIALALQLGSPVSYSELSNHSGSYYKKTLEIIGSLEGTYIARRLNSFSSNLRNEIKKMPKVYFYDTGLRNYLAQNFNSLDMRSGTERGGIAENFAFVELQKYIEPGFLYFWRTKAGAEVDFIVSRPNLLVPIEVKFANFDRPELTRSLMSFINTYKPKYAFVLNRNFIHIEEKNGTKIIFMPLAFV